MIKILGMLFFLFSFSNQSNDNQKQIDRMLEKVQKKYEATSNFKADFLQTITKKDVMMTFTRKGVVYFKKGGYMRWDYKEPDVLFYVSDGNYLYQYKPEDKVVYKMKIKGSGMAEPFKFLTGQAKLKDEFKIEKFEENDSSFKFYLLPKKKSAPFKKIVAEFSKKDNEIASIKIIDPVGNENYIKFSNISYDELPLSGFKLKIPAGIKVKEISK